MLAEVAHDGVGGAGAVVLARGQLHGVAVVGALDAEQVVVRRLGQRGVAGGGFQDGLGDHDRRVQVVLDGDGAGRLAHQRDELLGGEVLAVVARHVGRVVDVREGDGRHRDGHLLERRLGLALDDGGRVRLVRHAAGVAGLLDAGIDRIAHINFGSTRNLGGFGNFRGVGNRRLLGNLGGGLFGFRDGHLDDDLGSGGNLRAGLRKRLQDCSRRLVALDFLLHVGDFVVR